MNKWITFSDLCSRWKINKYDLAELVLNGKLQAHYDDDLSSLYILNDRVLRESRDGYVIGERQMPLTPGEVADCIFLISDVEEFERENGITPPGIKKSSGNRKLTDRQKDIDKATAIANKYIADCESEGEIPRIYIAVKLIEKAGKLSREYTGKHTIRDWIKGCFTEVSRRQGQGRPKKE
jgi:hypothetical protein